MQKALISIAIHRSKFKEGNPNTGGGEWDIRSTGQIPVRLECCQSKLGRSLLIVLGLFALSHQLATAQLSTPTVSQEIKDNSLIACLGHHKMTQAWENCHYPELDDGVVHLAEAGRAEGDAIQPDKTKLRELGADEDPLGVDQITREIERSGEKKHRHPGSSGRSNAKLDLYGSLRVRYRALTDESEWQDGSSRIGIDAEKRINEGSFLFGRYEVGFNVLSDLDGIVNAGETRGEGHKSNIFSRLLYAGLDAQRGTIVAGKNWSSYYEVASFTDRYMGLGGNASGTYNAQTDGGPTGSGRSDRTVQTKFSVDILSSETFKPIELNLQLQYGNPIPFGSGADYGIAGGISAIVTTKRNLSVGFAHNYAAIDRNQYQSLKNIGISGNARATIAGVRTFGKRWYAGMVVARLENHETTDDSIYFDGWGSELYAQYKVHDRVWLIGGFNALQPDSNQLQARDYRTRYAVAGLRYTFDSFRRMLFANIRFDDSRNTDGVRVGNVYTVGVRWDFTTHGRGI